MGPLRTFAFMLAALLPCAARPPLKAPYGGSAEVYCSPVVVAQMKAAWQADEQGRLRGGTWEYGFRIDYAFGQVQVGELVLGDRAFHSKIPTNSSTIAIAHVHPLAGESRPSLLDLSGSLPDYVISQDGIFLTDPKTHAYRALVPFRAMFSGCPRRK